MSLGSIVPHRAPKLERYEVALREILGGYDRIPDGTAVDADKLFDIYNECIVIAREALIVRLDNGS